LIRLCIFSRRLNIDRTRYIWMQINVVTP
jgi:hypothetical protein